jgi:tetratricopeptide (TPR) repeat protein
MATSFLHRRPVLIVLVLAVLGGLGAAGYFLWWRKREEPLPQPGSQAYEEYVRTFQLGVSYLDVDMDKQAEANLSQAIEKVPGEPAAWADRGLLHLRHNRLKQAASDLSRARDLAKDNPDIAILMGLLEEKQGRYSQAADLLREAVKSRPDDLEARYTLAQLIAKQRGPDSDQKYLALMDDILTVEPNNLFVLTEKARVAARLNNRRAFDAAVKRFDQLAPAWKPQTRDHLARLKKATAHSLRGETYAALTFFGNVLKAEPGYTRNAKAVNRAKQSDIGHSLHQFVRLAPPPPSTPAPPDLQITFTADALPGVQLGADRWVTILPVWLTDRTAPAVLVANGYHVRRVDADMMPLPFPGGKDHVPPSPAGVVALDWFNVFRANLLFAGAGGLRFFEQNKDGTFKDASTGTGLKPDVLGADYYGAWAADVDMDGDVDIIAAPRKGKPLLLRNNRDGTFTPFKPFHDVADVRGFVWADFDNDGAPDAALLDSQGKVHVFSNERAGQFHRRTPPDGLGKVLAIAQADVNDDGKLDLLALRSDGAILRVSDKDKGAGWDLVEIARWEHMPTTAAVGAVRLLVGDLDNNGCPDLIAAGPLGSQVWLGDSEFKFHALPREIKPSVFAVASLAADGRLDLLALSEGHQPSRLKGRPTRDYAWQQTMLRSLINKEVLGDDRVNSFCIGSEVEVRAGLLVQKQMTMSPLVHFGLGLQKQADIMRIVWPNGVVQMEFEPRATKTATVVQRTTTSCPFLFAHDGRTMEFVTDFMWNTPLGMFINAQDTGGIVQTEEWVKIRGDQLEAHDGFYGLRVTANLWEAHYYDYMTLMVVDHPPDTEIFTDERFFFKPTTPKVYVTGPLHPIAQARDDLGNDVTEIVRANDGRYLDTFGRGRFQGVTRDHWVEVDLGKDAPENGPVWLLARGWLHPTDSSINFALSQGNHARPQPLVLEVPDGHGKWKVARNDLGFPSGKNKTLVIRLDGVAGRGVARRFRLRTNMEIFWDSFHYARGLDADQAHYKRLVPESAELRYRGFQDTTSAGWSSPEIPHYEPAVHGQRYRDLIGYYTRYGDVRELLARVDDRYAILNGGDEIAMRFAVPPGPPRGWKRDFVWISDGWTKDGNLNTRFSKTVLPLPYHGMTSYNKPPGRLQDDPVYRRFPEDWKKYHTRYVTPDEFEQGLRAFRRPRP